jgi:hypothetical protein
MDHKKPLLALALLCAAGLSHAGEKEELLKLRNTTTNLIKQLVKQGILSDKTANDMIKQAEADADQQVAAAKSAAAPAEKASKEVVPADEVRVSYVPEFVKDEIRQQVRSELREEVVGDVMQKAKKEQWGLPGALPEWISRFKLSGDIRLREQSSFMASNNSPIGTYTDYPAINANNGNVNNQNQFVNTTNGRNQGRERVRLGIDAKITDSVDAGMRLATGNISNPISTNQSMGAYGSKYQFNLDRAFLRYNALDDNHFNWLTVMGGRTPNPFFTGGSEVVWDEDLSFEGIMGTVRHNLLSSDLSSAMGGKGPTIFGTAGMFPLQSSTGLSTRDKWMFGGQTGLDWGFDNQDALKLGAAYYDYRNITGKVDPLLTNGLASNSSAEVIQSAPQFMQYGNSLAPISNTGAGSLYGLASNYRILNFNALYDLALFSPHHLKFSADYAKNIGFNANDILSHYPGMANQIVTGGAVTNALNSAGTYAWQVRADLGWPKFDVAGHWSVFSLYKYVGSDAVLDAYTDSDFHLGGASNLGGTNVKGWVVGGNYGLMKNVWLTGKWLSGNMIMGPAYGVDLMQLDINTHF